MKRFRCISIGRVQGVWYRKSVQKAAREAGLRGWIRNLSDGTVESVVEVNDEAQLAVFEAILREGSPYSNVQKIDCRPYEGEEPLDDFEVKR